MGFFIFITQHQNFTLNKYIEISIIDFCFIIIIITMFRFTNKIN